MARKYRKREGARTNILRVSDFVVLERIEIFLDRNRQHFLGSAITEEGVRSGGLT